MIPVGFVLRCRHPVGRNDDAVFEEDLEGGLVHQRIQPATIGLVVDENHDVYIRIPSTGLSSGRASEHNDGRDNVTGPIHDGIGERSGGDVVVERIACSHGYRSASTRLN